MSKVSVLVVDDAPFIRDLMKKGLRSFFPGIQIEESVNGRKAQQLLERQGFDLILCDWEMPEMSGLELLSWCRTQDRLKTTPFIMVTSRGDKENVVQAIQAGVSDFIGKPFTNEQLVSKVKKALSRAGKLEALLNAAPPPVSSGFANDSLTALTGGKTAAPTPATASAVAAVSALSPFGARPAPAGLANRTAGPPASSHGQGHLRLPSGNLACVIKALSLKEALLLVKRAEPLPQVLASAVLDLEQRAGESESEGEAEGREVARLNGYLHAIAAFEAKPDSEWLQLTLRFVDRDPQKLDYLSRLIAGGSVQKHFSPGA